MNLNTNLKTSLCTICGRKGSKGVKNKNVRLIAGKPLFLHTLDLVENSGLFDFIVVSTDDPKIKQLCNGRTLTIVDREPALCGDDVGKLPVIRDAVIRTENLCNLNFDIVFDFDITSPLRNHDDIKGAYEKMLEPTGGNLISVCESRRSPYFNMVEISRRGAVFVSKNTEMTYLTRQETPIVYELNASIYGWTRKALMEVKNESPIRDDTILWHMPRSRSIDIDDELDFELVEFLLNKRRET